MVKQVIEVGWRRRAARAETARTRRAVHAFLLLIENHLVGALVVVRGRGHAGWSELRRECDVGRMFRNKRLLMGQRQRGMQSVPLKWLCLESGQSSALAA